MVPGHQRGTAILAAVTLCLVAGCSQAADGDPGADPTGARAGGTANLDAEPGTSLAFEWSANGFEQVSGDYKWTGSGVRDDVFEPHFALSVPETDDAIWSSSCAAGGKVETRLYLAPPKGMKDNRVTFRFETDRSAATRSYPARYVTNGQYDGFAIIQRADDPMFGEMKAGKWAYIQIGEGSDAAKLRVSLAGAARSLGAFLPACTGSARKTPPTSASPAISYTCEDGRTIAARYLGNDTDTPVARLVIDGKTVLLSQAVAGSGASCEGEQGGQCVVWLTKADDGFLIVADASDAADETGQTTRCSAR